MAIQGAFRRDLKIIIIGTSGTGKTSFVNNWPKKNFSDTYKATNVSELGFKIFEQESENEQGESVKKEKKIKCKSHLLKIN